MLLLLLLLLLSSRSITVGDGRNASARLKRIHHRESRDPPLGPGQSFASAQLFSDASFSETMTLDPLVLAEVHTFFQILLVVI